ncbi:MAG: cell envelope integrity protein TolA [Gallionella sp.]|nr:cell envelope integrity protein TolA [Gallionella sp.]MDD4946233.1 cell envelope integrity protein TolA [Gallionella sp.]
MSAVVYQEPYKLPAGIMALAVHGLFFAFLYFGFSWQTQTPPVMSVELWQSLPDPVPAPPVKAVVKETPPPAKVEPVVKPDIVMPDKKPEKKVEPPKPLEKPKPPEKIKPEVKKPAEVKKQVSKPDPAVLAAEQQAAREKAAQEAATGRVVDEYISKISGKIRRNIVMPPDVPNDARAEFLVTLLPGGRVLDVKLKKSSGNAAYDSAVERSILKSDPLPLPPDAGLFNRFRELRLGFQPIE